MAEYRFYNESGTVNVDLSVAKNEHNDYLQESPAGRVSETWDLNLFGSTWQEIEAGRIAIQKALFEAERAIQRQRQSDMVWLERTIDGANERQALVYGGNLRIEGNVDPYCGEIVAIMTFQRHPRAEGDAAGSAFVLLTDGTPLDLTGFAASLNSVAPARIESIKMATVGASLPAVIENGWIGIQPVYDDGGIFDPILDMGGTGSPTQITFVYPDHLKKTSKAIVESNASNTDQANLAAYRGKFRVLVLLDRTAGVTDPVTVSMQAGIGPQKTEKSYHAWGNQYANHRARYVDLGEIFIPGIGPFDHAAPFTDGSAYINATTVDIYAGCEDLTTVLDVYEIVLMPANHIIAFNSVQFGPAEVEGDRLDFYVQPNESLFGASVGFDNLIQAFGRPSKEANVGAEGWYLPPEGGVMVAVMQNELEETYGSSYTVGELLMRLDVRSRYFSL